MNLGDPSLTQQPQDHASMRLRFIARPVPFLQSHNPFVRPPVAGRAWPQHLLKPRHAENRFA
jgi:hypothetical protein